PRARSPRPARLCRRARARRADPRTRRSARAPRAPRGPDGTGPACRIPEVARAGWGLGAPRRWTARFRPARSRPPRRAGGARRRLYPRWTWVRAPGRARRSTGRRAREMREPSWASSGRTTRDSLAEEEGRIEAREGSGTIIEGDDGARGGPAPRDLSPSLPPPGARAASGGGCPGRAAGPRPR